MRDIALICFFLNCGVLTGPPQTGIFDKFNQSDFKIKFEHVDVKSYNKSVIKNLKIVTFKYNRTKTVCNVSLELKIDINNDIEVIIQAYKFASNEYRLFPLRFQVNGCFALSRNIVGVGDLKSCGNFTGCPLKKGIPIHVCNWSTDESKYPPFIPGGKYMVDIQFMYRSTEVAVVNAYGEIYRPIPIPKK